MTTSERRHEPTWPFLLILLILFILTATAPRSWRTVERPDPPKPQSGTASANTSAEQKSSRASGLARSTSDHTSYGESAQSAGLADPGLASPVDSEGFQAVGANPSVGDQAVWPDSFSQPGGKALAQADSHETNESNEPEELSGLGPRSLFDKVPSHPADQSSEAAQLWAELGQQPAGAAEPQAQTPQQSLAEQADDALDARHDQLVQQESQQPDAAQQGAQPDQGLIGASSGSPRSPQQTSLWTTPQSLLAMLQPFTQLDQTKEWAIAVQEMVEKLGPAFEEGAGNTRGLIEQLDGAVQRSAIIQLDLNQNQELAAQFRQVRYALIRRVTLWKAIDLVGGLKVELAKLHDGDWRRLSEQVTQVNRRLGNDPAAQGWAEFLGITSLSGVLSEYFADGTPSAQPADQMRELAEVVLTRVDHQQLTAEQRDLLQEPVIADYLNELRFWREGPVTTWRLLQLVEAFETSGLGSDGESILRVFYRLSQSQEEHARWVARCLDYLYRNANVRIVVSAALLERLAPIRPAEVRPLADVILNRPIYGSSTAQSEVSFRLIPDPQRARLALVVRGRVWSKTYSNAGPATVWNDSFARYVAEKPIEITPRGLLTGPAVINVENSLRLRNVSTTFDSIPILGFLTQEVARDQAARYRMAANEEAKWKVAANALHQIESEADSSFEELNQRIAREVFAPLARLNLTPTWVGAQTTAERMVLRLRLGAAMQPGGHTLRPFAPSNSLASCQIHESSANNFLAQLQLEGKTLTIAELQTKLREKLHLPDGDDPEESAHADATISFAARDAIRVEFREGRLAVILSVAELSSAPNHWENFQVRAEYRPEPARGQIQLERDGVIQLIGPKDMRSQIALRGVFSKTFSKNRPWQVSPGVLNKNPRLADLTISQLILEHGWLAFSLGLPSADIAQTPSG